MKRGTICWVNLEPASPPEFGKIRPGLVVSNSQQNAILDSLVIIPLSTQPGEIWPLRLRVPMQSGKDSYAVLPGLRQVHKARVLDAMGSAPTEFMRALDGALRAYLGD